MCRGGCGDRRERARRGAHGEAPPTPKHDDSETETEGEDELTCQADRVSYVNNGQTIPLSEQPCRDLVSGDLVRLMDADATRSNQEELIQEDAAYFFAGCNHHRAVYENSVHKRRCAVDGCYAEARLNKDGLRLCKLHSAKEERPKAAVRRVKAKIAPKAKSTPEAPPSDGEEVLVTEARSAPGDQARREKASEGEGSALLGTYLRAILQGVSEREALGLASTPSCGAIETRSLLREAAIEYLPKLPDEYPQRAREAVIQLILNTKEVEVRPTNKDPVLELSEVTTSGPLRRSSFSEEEVRSSPYVEPVPPPQKSEELGWQAFYRPKGSQGFPATMSSYGVGSSTARPPQAQDTLAMAARPRHLGAYTDGEPGHLDETAKALQAIAKTLTGKDEAAGQERGKLSSIGKTEERLAFLLRGCDKLTVPVCSSTVGKELYHALKSTSTQGRPQLRSIQFPVNINNRVAFGLASLSFGGKDTRALPEHCLSAADFPLTSEEDFDRFVGTVDQKLEKRPKHPVSLAQWYRNALRQAWAFCCVMGTEHYGAIESAATYLLKLGEEHSYMWPAGELYNVWEELWARFIEEVRELDRQLRRSMKEDCPTFERIRFFATAPGPDGDPWLRLPRTFFLEDPDEYFQTDVVPRQNRMLSRACWSVAHKKGANPLPGLRAGAEDGLLEDPKFPPKSGGTEADIRPEPKGGKAGKSGVKDMAKLLGPQLTAKEGARSLDHRPKDKKSGKYICWDHLSNRGCTLQNCPHFHAKDVPKFDTMDWSIQLQILRRGGLRDRTQLTEKDAAGQMAAIRANVQNKAKENAEEGRRSKAGSRSTVGGVEAPQEERDPKVGESPPEEFVQMCPTDMESRLSEWVQGGDQSFERDADEDRETRTYQVPEDLPEEAKQRYVTMKAIDDSGVGKDLQGQLGVYVRNRLLQEKEKDPDVELTTALVRHMLEEARAKGPPQVAAEADGLLGSRAWPKVGSRSSAANLTTFQWKGGVGHATMHYAGSAWPVYDYGDRLPIHSSLSALLGAKEHGSSDYEIRQCLLLHCTAGCLMAKTGKAPNLKNLHVATQGIRLEAAKEAQGAERRLGNAPEEMDRAEADVRVFAHDLTHYDHDKDYRCLIAFPSELYDDYLFNVVRMDLQGELTVETIVGLGCGDKPKNEVWLLVHQGHMRLLKKPAGSEAPPTVREVLAAGWEVHLDAAGEPEARVRARDALKCPRCVQSPGEARRTGKGIPRSSPVLGLYPLVHHYDKFGQTPPVPLETKDLPEGTRFSDAEIREWLGEQGKYFDEALKKGLNLLEVYAGEARATAAVRELGGVAMALGLDHGQDFRRARDRALGKALLHRLKPNHLWLAFPCTPFCAWARLAAVKGTDTGPRLREGRLHLKYSLSLARRQRMTGRHSHLENPLTSSAWTEPESLREFGDTTWKTSRLDQCTTGLSGLQGGLHKKPTRICTTSEAMQEALDRQCTGDHPHELVQGNATSRSAMYSPYMARLIALVVMQCLVKGGGGKELSLGPHHNPSKVGGPIDTKVGTEGDIPGSPAARFAPGSAEWQCPLKGPGLIPHYHQQGPMREPLEEEVRRATEKYLDFLNEREYTKQSFGEAAQLGTQVLRASHGWKEANRALRLIALERRGDHFEELHGDFFEGLVHPELLAKARENALHGIQAHSSCERDVRVRSTPHPSLREYLDEAASQLWKDACKGRALITEDDGTDLLTGVVSVPMARVPKMLPDRTLSDKGRVIWDATPVNQTCDKENHPPALQPRHSEMARAILWWKQRYPFARVLLSKKDISDAFKWVPVRLEDTRLFAADLPGKEFGVDTPISVIYNTLTFGWTGAPGEFMLFAWVAKLAHMGHAPEHPEWHDGTPFRSLVLMDDTVLIEPEVGVRPWMSVHAAERCTKATLGPDTINAAKDVIEGALEEQKLVWGLLYNTATGTRALPAAKLEKASYLLHLPEFDYGCTKVPLKLVQELRGNQQFWLTVLPTMANFLQASNELLGPPDSGGYAHPRGTPQRQRRSWIRFWEAVELQRLLVDNRLVWEARFTHPLTEALSVGEAMAFCREDVIWASGDATLEKVAAIDWSSKKAFAVDVADFQEHIKTFMKEACFESESEDEGFEDSGYIISVTELLAAVTLAALCARNWQGRLVLYGGDNQNVIGWLDKRQARHPVAVYLLQVLAALEAAHSFRFCGAYVRTYHNVTADDLTRKEPAQVMKEQGLSPLENAAEALRVYLERGWVKRALVWAGQADADRCQALRLADRRSGDTHPFLTQPKPGLDLTSVDLSGELQRYKLEFLSRGAKCYSESESTELEVNGLDVLTLTLKAGEFDDALNRLSRGAVRARPRLVWVDTLTENLAIKVQQKLKEDGYETRLFQVSGRTLKIKCGGVDGWLLEAELGGQASHAGRQMKNPSPKP